MKLSMHIRMLSDWHIGTGAGRHGGIDRLIARDADGLPYVPASTVRSTGSVSPSLALHSRS